MVDRKTRHNSSALHRFLSHQYHSIRDQCYTSIITEDISRTRNIHLLAKFFCFFIHLTLTSFHLWLCNLILSMGLRKYQRIVIHTHSLIMFVGVLPFQPVKVRSFTKLPINTLLPLKPPPFTVRIPVGFEIYSHLGCTRTGF